MSQLLSIKIPTVFLALTSPQGESVSLLSCSRHNGLSLTEPFDCLSSQKRGHREKENHSWVSSWVSSSALSLWKVPMNVKSLVLVLSITLICIALLRIINNSESPADGKEEDLFWPWLYTCSLVTSNVTELKTRTTACTQMLLGNPCFILYPIFQKKRKDAWKKKQRLFKLFQAFFFLSGVSRFFLRSAQLTMC